MSELFANYVVTRSKPFDLRRERRAWWRYVRSIGPFPKASIKVECPKTIKKYEREVVGFYDEYLHMASE